jgi:hypothetical protein
MELVKRISFMRKVYMPVRGKVKLFADLRSAAKHASSRESQAMFAAEPTLEMMCIQLKYDPWRNSLLSAWKKVGRRSVACRDVKSLRDDGLHERACHLHAVLVHVVRMVEQLLPHCRPTLITTKSVATLGHPCRASISQRSVFSFHGTGHRLYIEIGQR